MAVVFSEYAKDRVGWFFGLTGPQLIAVLVAGGPVLWAFNAKWWPGVAGFAAAWGLVIVLVVVPVHGRTATGLRCPASLGQLAQRI